MHDISGKMTNGEDMPDRVIVHL